ncbi:MAG: TRAP transporter small permease [Candidatus Magnetomorum sp.]|nr:TRAP transporter small permease [Candidatus Magnetomorum sp.]
MKPLNFIHHLYPSVLLFNWAAALSVLAMMVLTCIDVFLRFLRCPIPGVYETIGLIGALFVSFSLANTSMTHSHIAVDFIVKKFSQATQRIIHSVYSIISTGFFGLIAWQSFWYALDLRASGEVSSTLQIPTYPFVLGISIGCIMLCLLLFAQCLEYTLSDSNQSQDR